MNHILTMRDNFNLVGFNDFLRFLDKFSDLKNSTIVEIGSYIGESTIMFANKAKLVISIDPFMNGYDSNDEASYLADLPTVVYQKYLENTAPYSNIQHIKKTSDDAVIDIKELVDLVYIDGVHTYEQVKKDIENYRGLVKPGGFLCGHDYVNAGHLAGVYQAVNEIFDTPDITFCDYTWVVKL